MQEPQCLVFGPFRLDLCDERLWHGHEGTSLSPKIFAVLRCLVSQAGQLVTKDALLMTVWPKTAVSESALTVAIRQLRRVLSDQARTPRFIETVHRRGYRFMAPVAVAEPSPQRHQTAEMLRPPLPVARVGSTLFVGRESELAQVHRWFTTALQGTRQVGIILGFHPEHVRRLIRTGRLRAALVGGDYRVALSDLWPLLEVRYRQPGRRRLVGRRPS